MPLTGKRILVVEDEPLIRLSVANLLGQSGFSVLEAANGDEALSADWASCDPFESATVAASLCRHRHHPAFVPP